MTPNELSLYITKLAQENQDYNTVCNNCVDVMLKARRTFTEAAGYSISGEQAAMIGAAIKNRLS